MLDKAILDTGVIVAIYFEEDASERAVEVASEHSPITVDLAVAEVGNAAWKRVALFGEGKD
ncbi:MAG: type II toxin-antitoxin system VapC family toxin, partial [Methanothrix sp.]|nr:type II toxin-antitoxin system VapC family toxin [Methanothrix sp.]